ALGGNLVWMAIAVTLGSAFGTFFMAFHSTQGPRLGLPQMIQSRPQFGYTGALLVWAVALIAYIGFNAFNQVLAAQALHQLSGAIAPTSPAAIILFAVAAVSLAAVGYDKIHMAQRGFAYLMVAILTVFSVGALFMLKVPPAQWDPAGFKAVPFLAELFAAASYQLSWSIYVSDYSRYLPRDVGARASFWWTYLGAFIGGTWMMLVGTIAAATTSAKLDVAAAMERAADAVIPGLGWVLLFGGLLGLVTISALNFYGASLTLLSVADTCKPLQCTVGKRLASLLAAMLVSTGIALSASGDFINRFADLLSVLLYLFTPWTAINLVDFYIVRKGHYSIREIFNPSGMYGQWNWRGLLAYGVGFVAMIPFFSTGLYKGPVARALGGADIAMLVGLPIAAAVYLIACRSVDLERDRIQARAADIDLEPGDPSGA
ncbi:MAG: permease for cytosine/purine, uracil, thiamine, allantoin family protein, partial [Gammaproteobacteria bacterium]|nr:permease for cytosine/purine, uracil, thiamine, allantoin family protein [Gammaproteobacteria bacterium]